MAGLALDDAEGMLGLGPGHHDIAVDPHDGRMRIAAIRKLAHDMPDRSRPRSGRRSIAFRTRWRVSAPGYGIAAARLALATCPSCGLRRDWSRRLSEAECTLAAVMANPGHRTDPEEHRSTAKAAKILLGHRARATLK
jgi:hypothetical protein